MGDSFDMACNDDARALRLNIKVNSENLLPTTRKYNVGSLRLPADPSWPKVPQRRVVGEAIEPPRAATSTGTPRRSRTTVRSTNGAATEDSTNPPARPGREIPRRSPGCADPRFKRVTSVRSQMTSIGQEFDSSAQTSRRRLAAAKEIQEPISERDTDAPRRAIQHPAEKPDEAKTTESVGIQTQPIEDEPQVRNERCPSSEEARRIDRYVSASGPRVSFARRRTKISRLRKASSCSRRYSRVLVVNPDGTLAWQKRRGVKRRNGERRSLPIIVIKRDRSAVPAASPIDESPIIPAKTQRLLNESYWNYYNKLNLRKTEQRYACHVAMGAPRTKKRRAEEPNDRCGGNRLSLPEMRTLEQCSVLSSMINKTLEKPENVFVSLRDSSALQQLSDTVRTTRLFVNSNVKSSSDPTAGSVGMKIFTPSPRLEHRGDSHPSKPLERRKRKQEKRADERPLKLGTIVFFGFVMYAAIVFLPMIYDFFLDEYDDYEESGYIELALDYVLSSFKEAFGGLLDVADKIFLRPRACRKCNNAA